MLILKPLISRKNDLKSIDFIAASFRRELENDDLWGNSGGESDSDEDESLKVKKTIDYSKTQNNNSAVFVEAKKSQPSKVIMTVKANYSFEAENDNEMSLQKGEIIEVTKKIDEGWWIGRCGSKSGMFPANYVSVYEEKSKNDKVFDEVEILTLETSENTETVDSEPRENQSNSMTKPGFSYLPQGTPISFIGRKKGDVSASTDPTDAEISVACGQCDCEEFAANVFKPGHCNNCFHKH